MHIHMHIHIYLYTLYIYTYIYMHTHTLHEENMRYHFKRDLLSLQKRPTIRKMSFEGGIKTEFLKRRLYDKFMQEIF